MILQWTGLFFFLTTPQDGTYLHRFVCLSPEGQEGQVVQGRGHCGIKG